MMLSSIQFSWIIKQIIKVEPEPGQSDGSGSSQIPRLWAAPAPKPWYFYLVRTLLCFLINFRIRTKIILFRLQDFAYSETDPI